MAEEKTIGIIALLTYFPPEMAKKSKGNRILIKLYNEETGEFKIKPFHRQVIDVANYTANLYSSKLRKHVVFKAKKLK